MAQATEKEPCAAALEAHIAAKASERLPYVQRRMTMPLPNPWFLR